MKITLFLKFIVFTTNAVIFSISHKNYSLKTSMEDLEKIKEFVDRSLNKYPEDNHPERCKWQSTKKVKAAFLDNSIEHQNNSAVMNPDKKIHPVLIQSFCIGLGTYISVDNPGYLENYSISRYCYTNFFAVVGNLRFSITDFAILLESLGNTLGQYFENRICANLSGVHFVTVARRWLPRGEEEPFLQALPALVLHPIPTPATALEKISSICPCDDMCHEYQNGLLHRYHQTVKDMFLTALQAQWKTESEKVYLRPSPIPHASVVGNFNASLPLLPDVAIHYRCGDNTVGHYGFLPFRAFSQLIPKDPAQTRHIYVMTEGLSRKARVDQRNRCDAILKHLHLYLVSEFPFATVLLLRGQNIFTDLYRLTHSKLVICSVSTYCLWPAIAATGQVYFPVTRLVAKATTPNYGPHFHWIVDPPVLQGVKTLGMTNDHVVKLLKSKN